MRGIAVAVGFAAVAAGFAAAIGLFFLGGIFGLNGEQWEWWRWAAWTAAAFVLVAPVFRVTRVAALPLQGAVGTGVAGAALLAVSVLVMRGRYSDPYLGTLLWAHVLAVIAFAGFALMVAALALADGDRRSRA